MFLSKGTMHVTSQYSKRKFSGAICALDCDRFERRYILGCTENGFFFSYDVYMSQEVFYGCIPTNSILTDVKWSTTNPKMFAVSSYDTNLRVYDSSKLEQPIYEYPFGSKIHSCTFNPKSPIIAASMELGLTRIIDIREKANLNALRALIPNEITNTRWIPDSEYAVICGDEIGNIYLFDIRKPEEPYQFNWWKQKVLIDDDNSPAHESGIIGLCFTENNRHFYSMDKKGTIRMWNVDDGLSAFVQYQLKEPAKYPRNLEIDTFNGDLFVPESNRIRNLNKSELFVGHAKDVVSISSFDDGIATGGCDSFLCIWRSDYEDEIYDVSDWSD